MNSLLSKPFPAFSEKKDRIKSAALIGIFVFAFLSVFKPFGLSNVKGPIYLITALYGLITTGTLFVTQLLFPLLAEDFYSEKSWTVGREIAHTMANVLLIAIGNFGLSCWLGFFPWSTDTFLLFVGFTGAIGIIPVTIQVLIRQNIYHRRNAEAVKTDNAVIEKRSNQESTTIRLSVEDSSEDFQAPSQQILALESSGNYIDIHEVDEQKTVIRKSITSAENELDEPFFRTHRSWIVNLSKISKVHGNARGYTLQFEKSSIEVPVSRTKLKSFDQKLAEISR
jgi:hypothetical protein